MNRYLKAFLHRGLIFGGFGPIVVGIIYLTLSMTLENFSVSGKEMFFAIISTYLLAFLHAGASIFNQIEEWPIAKSMFFHFSTLYLAYVMCYLFNDWLKPDFKVIMIFTGVFAVIYFIIWAIVVISIKITEKRLNARLR